MGMENSTATVICAECGGQAWPVASSDKSGYWVIDGDVTGPTFCSIACRNVWQVQRGTQSIDELRAENGLPPIVIDTPPVVERHVISIEWAICESSPVPPPPPPPKRTHKPAPLPPTFFDTWPTIEAAARAMHGKGHKYIAMAWILVHTRAAGIADLHVRAHVSQAVTLGRLMQHGRGMYSLAATVSVAVEQTEKATPREKHSRAVASVVSACQLDADGQLSIGKDAAEAVLVAQGWSKSFAAKKLGEIVASGHLRRIKRGVYAPAISEVVE